MANTTTDSVSLNAGISVKQLAQMTGGRLLGKDDLTVRNFCAIEEPREDSISFSKLKKKTALEQQIRRSGLTALIISEDAETPEFPENEMALIVVPDPLHAIAGLCRRFLSTPLPEAGISPLADVHPKAMLGKNVHIGAFCSVAENAQIGDNAVLFPHVVVYSGAVIGTNSVIHSGAVIREKTKIGAFCVIQNGAVIGADGFGYYLSPQKTLEAVPQVGIVELGDKVDVGANACIDRATLGTTEIGTSSKIDNLVQIGHNVRLGQGCIVCGQTGIAGSCNIGAGVTLAGAVGVGDHINIVSGVRVGGKGVVASDITEPGDYMGHPVLKAADWRRMIASQRHLPRLLSDIKALKKDKN